MTTFCSNNIAQARLADYRRRPVSAGLSKRPARPGGPGRGPWLAEPSGGSGCRGARLVQTVAVRVASRLVRAVSRLGDERSPGPQALASGLERKTPSPNLKTRRPKKNTTTPHTSATLPPAGRGRDHSARQPALGASPLFKCEPSAAAGRPDQRTPGAAPEAQARTRGRRSRAPGRALSLSEAGHPCFASSRPPSPSRRSSCWAPSTASAAAWRRRRAGCSSAARR